jgi:hypothetical protein
MGTPGSRRRQTRLIVRTRGYRWSRFCVPSCDRCFLALRRRGGRALQIRPRRAISTWSRDGGERNPVSEQQVEFRERDRYQSFERDGWALAQRRDRLDEEQAAALLPRVLDRLRGQKRPASGPPRSGNTYRGVGPPTHGALLLRTSIERVCLPLVVGSCCALICAAPSAMRWQMQDGRAFLRPAPARSRTVERQPAVRALVVGEPPEGAGLDRTRAGALGDCSAVARAETRFLHPLL